MIEFNKGTTFMYRRKNKWVYENHLHAIKASSTSPYRYHKYGVEYSNPWGENYDIEFIKKRKAKEVRSIDDVIGFYKEQFEKVRNKHKEKLVEDAKNCILLYAAGKFSKYKHLVPTEEKLEEVVEAFRAFSFDYNFAFDEKEVRSAYREYADRLEEKKIADEKKRLQLEEVKREQEEKRELENRILEEMGDAIDYIGRALIIKDRVLGYEIIGSPEGYKLIRTYAEESNMANLYSVRQVFMHAHLHIQQEDLDVDALRIAGQDPLRLEMYRKVEE